MVSKLNTIANIVFREVWISSHFHDNILAIYIHHIANWSSSSIWKWYQDSGKTHILPNSNISNGKVSQYRRLHIHFRSTWWAERWAGRERVVNDNHPCVPFDNINGDNDTERPCNSALDVIEVCYILKHNYAKNINVCGGFFVLSCYHSQYNECLRLPILMPSSRVLYTSVVMSNAQIELLMNY